MSKHYSDGTVLSAWAKAILDASESQEDNPKPKAFMYHMPDWMSGMVSEAQLRVMAQQKIQELQPAIDKLETSSITAIVHAAYEFFGKDVDKFISSCLSHQARLDTESVDEVHAPHETAPAEEPPPGPKEMNYEEQGATDAMMDDDNRPDTPPLPQGG